MNNPFFAKSVRLLAHPLSLAAIGLMLANDFILKPLWPSWFTGKLSDFAGLFFLPFLLAALFSLVLPRRWVGWLAFGAAAAGFALLKLDSGLNAALLEAVNALSGLRLQARPDPTDLLALVSLLPAAWLWRGVDVLPAFNRRWLLVLPLAALVTLADAAAPDLGVGCLSQSPTGTAILATTGYLVQTYQSQDGGLTWQPLESGGLPTCTPGSTTPTDLKNPADGSLYRFVSGKSIERSTDDGANWKVDYAFTPLTEPDQMYMKLTHTGNIQFGFPPYAAAVDQASGNVVVAMGLDGVLVRRLNGDWTWAVVGPYQHNSLKAAGVPGLLLLLQSQIFLAVLAGLGWYFTRASHLHAGRTTIWVILGWIALGVVSLLLIPDVQTATYVGAVSAIGLLVMAFAILVGLLVSVIRLKGRAIGLFFTSLPQILLIALACLLPYALWAANLLPHYTSALLASSGLLLVSMVLMWPRKLRKSAENEL